MEKKKDDGHSFPRDTSSSKCQIPAGKETKVPRCASRVDQLKQRVALVDDSVDDGRDRVFLGALRILLKSAVSSRRWREAGPLLIHIFANYLRFYTCCTTSSTNTFISTMQRYLWFFSNSNIIEVCLWFQIL